MLHINLTIEGIQELQAANNRAIASLRPVSSLGRAIQYSVIEAHRYAISITHVDTGALRAAHRSQLSLGGSEPSGSIYLDPGATNPRTGARVIDYGSAEHKRGGSHAFYTRTVRERGAVISERAVQIISEGIKW